MDAKMIEKAKEKFCDEIEPIVKKSSISSGDFDTLYKAICGYEKALKIEEMDEGGQYSQRGQSQSMRGGNWTAEGSYGRNGGSYSGGSYNGNSRSGNSYTGNSYDNGESYGNYSEANRGMHYVRGHYSRAEGSEMVKDHIMKAMREDNLSGSDRMILEKAMDILA